jgi:hypothetical protein
MSSRRENAARNAYEVLQEALTFLRVSARTEDYFAGYSLSEAIADRIAIIGSDDGSTTQRAPRGGFTQIAEINRLEQALNDVIDSLENLEDFNYQEDTIDD